MSNQAPKLEFWYEFPSTYSYLSAMRIEAWAVAGVGVDWTPLLLGPILNTQRWTTSPLEPARRNNAFVHWPFIRLGA